MHMTRRLVLFESAVEGRQRVWTPICADIYYLLPQHKAVQHQHGPKCRTRLRPDDAHHHQSRIRAPSLWLGKSRLGCRSKSHSALPVIESQSLVIDPVAPGQSYYGTSARLRLVLT